MERAAEFLHKTVGAGATPTGPKDDVPDRHIIKHKTHIESMPAINYLGHAIEL
jgi:hypothetical protein